MQPKLFFDIFCFSSSSSSYLKRESEQSERQISTYMQILFFRALNNTRDQFFLNTETVLHLLSSGFFKSHIFEIKRIKNVNFSFKLYLLSFKLYLLGFGWHKYTTWDMGQLLFAILGWNHILFMELHNMNRNLFNRSQCESSTLDFGIFPKEFYGNKYSNCNASR